MTKRVGHVNVGPGRLPRIGGLLANHAPDVLVITEARSHRKRIRRQAKKHGYRRMHKRGPQRGDTAILVKRGQRFRRRGLMKMRRPWWWGPNRSNLRKRNPRRYPKAAVDGWRVLGVHFPPGGPKGAPARTGGKNKRAWHESARRIVRKVHRWRTRKPNQPVVVPGDFNCSYEELIDHIVKPLTALGHRVEVVRFGKVDACLIVGGREIRTHRLRNKPGQHGRGITTIQED